MGLPSAMERYGTATQGRYGSTGQGATMNNELKARVEEANRIHNMLGTLEEKHHTKANTLINDLSTALQEARAESHDAMNKAQAMVGTLEQQLHDTEARLREAVETLARISNLDCFPVMDTSDAPSIARGTIAKIKEMEGSDE